MLPLLGDGTVLVSAPRIDDDEFDKVDFLPLRELTGTTPASNSASQVSSNDSNALRNTLSIYGTTFLVALLFYCFIRRRCPKVYNVRNSIPQYNCALAAQQEYDGFIRWMWRLWLIPDETILRQCGLDALCYLRVLHFGFRLTLLGSFNSIWLIPLYATASDPSITSSAGNETSTDYLIPGDVLLQWSLAHVPARSRRLGGVVVAAYILYGFIMHQMLRELSWYTKHKHLMNSLSIPRNYAIYIDGVPAALRSNRALRNYFECLGEVHEAAIALEVKNLAVKVGRRKTVISRIEHELARQLKEGPTCFGNDGMDILEQHKVELDELNMYIRDEIARLEERQEAGLFKAGVNRLKRDLYSTSNMNGEKFGSHRQESVQASPDLLLPEAGPGFDILIATGELRTSSSEGFANSLGPSPEDILSCTNATQTQRLHHGQSANRSQSYSMPSTVDDAIVETQSFPTSQEAPMLRDLPRHQLSPTESEADHNSASSEQSARESQAFQDLHGASLNRIENDSQALSTLERQTSRNQREDARLENAPELAVSEQATHDEAASMGTEQLLPSEELKEPVEPMSQEDDTTRGLIPSLAATAAMVSDLGYTAIKKANSILTREDGTPFHAGFVTFKTLHSTHIARQMIHHEDPFLLDVSDAPSPEDILWDNVGKPLRAVETGRFFSLGVTTTLCLFWTVPVSFVSSLTNVQSLRTSVEFLDDWLEAFPALEGILAQIAPLLIYLLNEILVLVMRVFSRWEGPVSEGLLEASLFSKLALFQIIQTFLVSSISGTITGAIQFFATSPIEAVRALAAALPAQATYFNQIVLVTTFVSLFYELLRITPLFQAWLRGFLGPNLTEDERDRMWLGLRPLSNPRNFLHARVFAMTVLFFMIMFVYSIMAPVTNYTMLLCFLLMGSAYRNQFIYIYPPTNDSGGKLWSTFTAIAISIMAFGQLILIGSLGLKESPVMAGLMIPLLGVTLVFSWFIRRRHFQVANSLPVRTCLELDHVNQACGHLDMSFLDGAYVQPVLKVKEVQVDFDSNDPAKALNQLQQSVDSQAFKPTSKLTA